MFDRRSVVVGVLASAAAGAPALAVAPPTAVAFTEREIERVGVAIMSRIVEGQIARGEQARFSLGGLAEDKTEFTAEDGTVHRVSLIVAGNEDELIDVLVHTRSDATFLRIRGIKRRPDGPVTMIYVMDKLDA